VRHIVGQGALAHDQGSCRGAASPRGERAPLPDPAQTPFAAVDGDDRVADLQLLDQHLAAVGSGYACRAEKQATSAASSMPPLPSLPRCRESPMVVPAKMNVSVEPRCP